MSLCMSSIRRLANLSVCQRHCLQTQGRRWLYVRQQPPPPADALPAVEPVQVDWAHVERLLPRRTVPVPAEKPAYPSGWTPQQGNPSLPYSVRRSVNHMLPVYLRIMEDGSKRLTVIKHVRGDIWKLHEDLKRHVEKTTGKYIASRVNEVSQYIQFKGQYVQEVKDYLRERGL